MLKVALSTKNGQSTGRSSRGAGIRNKTFAVRESLRRFKDCGSGFTVNVLQSDGVDNAIVQFNDRDGGSL